MKIRLNLSKIAAIASAWLLTGITAKAEPEKRVPYSALHKSLVSHETSDGDREPLRSDYFVAFVQLDGAGAKEAVVIFHGPYYCGSGGCSMKVLRQLKDGSFRVTSEVSLCRKDEIWVSKDKHNFWNDLVVNVSGGGAMNGKRVLKHNGNSYPANPSVEGVYEGGAEKLTPLVFLAVPATDSPFQDLKPKSKQ